MYLRWKMIILGGPLFYGWHLAYMYTQCQGQGYQYSMSTLLLSMRFITIQDHKHKWTKWSIKSHHYGRILYFFICSNKIYSAHGVLRVAGRGFTRKVNMIWFRTAKSIVVVAVYLTVVMGSYKHWFVVHQALQTRMESLRFKVDAKHYSQLLLDCFASSCCQEITSTRYWCVIPLQSTASQTELG